MCNSADSIPGDIERSKKIAALEQRRCVVLAIIASTPPPNPSLNRILSRGLLTSLKPWLDDILTSNVGSVDLLLHFLSSITELPVTRSHVQDSGMGKKVGSIEKHPICVGSANESAIKDRIQKVKNSWNASVKALKDNGSPPDNKKRPADSASFASKKLKTEDLKPSLSNLLSKVSNSPPSKKNIVAKRPAPLKSLVAPVPPGTSAESDDQPKSKKSSKRVKWSDHFGGNLEQAREIEGNRGEQPVNNGDDKQGGDVSWSDRRKRDRLREKELLAEAKKKKLLDDDDEDIFTQQSAIMPTIAWHTPQVTPERADLTKTQVDSKELVTQSTRIAQLPAVEYAADHLIPSNPTPMTDVESAIDMQAEQSSTPATIPFFAPQETVPQAVAPSPAPFSAPAVPPAPAPFPSTIPPPPPPPANTGGATTEMVQALGLPLFLVGSNVQALQTIASNPSLLSTYVDANGMYDQQNLLTLVQTLGQSMPNQTQPQSQQPAQPQTFGNQYSAQTQQNYGSTSASSYGPASVSTTAAVSAPVSFNQTSHYGPSSSTATRSSGYRGDQNTTEANLHLTGYGTTANQAEIIALFSPYVRVKEVVMKNGFCFVNTNDPVGAKNAKDALNGAIVGGMPVRINMAQRRNRETATIASSITSAYTGAQATVPCVPRAMVGQGDSETVRDDRGNPATKNLFVAGYGPGTTEQELRGLFAQHATITGCVVKGNFSFVNTTDKHAAVVAREALTGAVVNGGVLRINFAKETGRLGTSFDLTYNQATGGQQPGTRSYYGR
eukprot:CAMPEP_0178931562 /NCGR_PEP_ID=MMETSP0786-20121207/21989_1 /TAXON_ID=186022 /ORGANISM="Thalassionema frauenfeldii, Strain CCMP 1798" /LENGTH=779 /DNA_ID=CAMNT_0020608473 /DNA_START=1987 /DNA_END=4326 /DNA_ORIENTATION=-